MNNLHRILLGFSLIAIALFSITSCVKSPEVKPEHDQEEITKFVAEFINQETGAKESITFDAAGKTLTESINLKYQQEYELHLFAYNHDKLINAEFVEHGDEHQFFFIPDIDFIFDYQYLDQDALKNGIGLKGKFKIILNENFKLSIILRHGLDKTHPAAQQYDSPNYREAGGADDLHVQFNIHVTD